MIYSNEERKKPIEHYVDGLTFRSCVDLSCGITVDKDPWLVTIPPEMLIGQAMNFATWWTLNYHPHLNGFSGIDSVQIKCNF